MGRAWCCWRAAGRPAALRQAFSAMPAPSSPHEPILLRLMGHDIQTAHDGLEAIQAAATFRPDVVLLDIGMPKMNGYEAARWIRQQPWGKNMLLVALTGWGQEEDKRRAAEAGFDHHLTKPVDPDALQKILAEVDARWAAGFDRNV